MYLSGLKVSYISYVASVSIEVISVGTTGGGRVVGLDAGVDVIVCRNAMSVMFGSEWADEDCI